MANSYELDGRLRNPWATFTQRDEKKHQAEDDARLCPSLQVTSSAVIDQFLSFDSNHLQSAISHRHRILRDYLKEAISTQSAHSNQTVERDITDSSVSADIAILDDRQNHTPCARANGNVCGICNIYSTNLSVPQLFQRLKEQRKVHKAEKRIIFIPNITPACALALGATCARRTASPLRGFLHRYLSREHNFSISTSWGFFLEFHIPYHALRIGPLQPDRRKLRTIEELPLKFCSRDKDTLYYCQAQTSSLSLGPDDWFWTEYFLVDTYFGSEPKLHLYLANCPPGDGFDPPLGGQGLMTKPYYDPRQYWLVKVDRRVTQAAMEYTALIETFDRRMEDYAAYSKRNPDTPPSIQTGRLGEVIEVIQLFVDDITATVDAWDRFYRSKISYFTIHASDKPSWPAHIDNIVQSISELDRLRKLLLTKRDRFNLQLQSLHAKSSLKQTETAISQGDYIRTLTQMTVYVAFPLLFTTALFSMQFMQITKLKVALPLFFAILIVTTLMNYLIASHRSPIRRWLHAKLE